MDEELQQQASSKVPDHRHNGFDASPVSFNDISDKISSKVRVHSSINQGLTIGAPRKIVFDIEDFDIKNEYDPTKNRFTARDEGYYLITCHLEVTAASTGDINFGELRVNNISQVITFSYASTTTQNNIIMQDMRKLLRNDFVEIFIDRQGAGNYSIISGSARTFLSIHRLS